MFFLFLPLFLLLQIPSLTISTPTLHNLNLCPSHLPPPQRTRIINGHSPSEQTISHLISFHQEGCGASLISPLWILTAAHCLIQTTSIPTYAGNSSSNGTPLKIKQVIVHPNYDFPNHDIALVELETPVQNASYFKLNSNPSVPQPGEFVRVAGYGHTHEFEPSNPHHLIYQVDIPTVSTASCIAKFDTLPTGIQGKITANQHICAGYEKGSCDSCTQDSGGPLFLYQFDRSLVQVGIVSFGYGCGRKGVPGGYLRISSYIQWMKNAGVIFEQTSERDPVFMEGFGNTPQTPAEPPKPSQIPTVPSSTTNTNPNVEETQIPSSTTAISTSPLATGPVPTHEQEQPTPASISTTIGEENPPATPTGPSLDLAPMITPVVEVGETNEVVGGSENAVDVALVVGTVLGAAAALAIVVLLLLWRKRNAALPVSITTATESEGVTGLSP